MLNFINLSLMPSTKLILSYVIFFLPSKQIIYYSESKVLQYFSNMKHDSAALDAFAKGLKVENHSGL